MRAEIGRCQDHQVAVLQFGFVVLGATAGLAALYADRLRRLIDVAILVVASAIAVLAFWMVAADETRGIRSAEAATGTPSGRPAAR